MNACASSLASFQSSDESKSFHSGYFMGKGDVAFS